MRRDGRRGIRKRWVSGRGKVMRKLIKLGLEQRRKKEVKQDG